MDNDIKELLQDIPTEQLIIWLQHWQEQLNAHYSQKIRTSFKQCPTQQTYAA